MPDKQQAEKEALVSVVIPTHNRVELLRRALASVFRQTYPRLEIVIVDDGSSDETSSLIRGLQAKYANLVYVRHDRAKGASAARNSGFQKARGEYLALLDDDDEFTEDRISTLLVYLQRSPEPSFVCSDYLSIRRNGTRRSHKPGRINLQKILWTNYAGQSILTRREKMLAVGGFDEQLTAAQDHDAFTRLIERFGPAYRLGKVLYLYHQEHDAPRITSTPVKRLRGYYAYYLKHKHLMSRAQRAWHLYRLLKIRGRAISWKQFLQMVPPQYFFMELNDYFIYHTNLYLWLNRFSRAMKKLWSR